ncbi:MAG: hypothetical protein Q9218_006064 [Villophora microphyllina]
MASARLYRQYQTIDFEAHAVYTGGNKETTLHLAARDGDEAAIKSILRSSNVVEVISLRDSASGRTPLITACIHGHLPVVQLLVKAGADTTLTDDLGWTASTLVFKKRHYIHCHQNLFPKRITTRRSHAKAVELEKYLWDHEDELQCQAGFTLEVSLAGTSAPKHLIHLPLVGAISDASGVAEALPDSSLRPGSSRVASTALPVLAGSTTQPMLFTVAGPHKAKVMFRLFRAQDDRAPATHHIGTGMTILKSLRANLGPNHESLVRDHTIPILDKNTLDAVGSVTFNFLVITPTRARPRSRSEHLDDDDQVEELRRRMKYTDEGHSADIKGNLRGYSFQEPSTTLEELLTNLSRSVDFNLKMKHPMLWEAEDRNIPLYTIKPNLFVDTTLAMVYRPAGDIRARNLQQAIGFPKAWGLAGIVMLSDVFVESPRLIGYAKSKRLVVASYENLNDDPVQAEAGLNAIITNKVRLIK